MYLKHYYPIAKQMLENNREEFMTAKTTSDPSKLDNIEVTSKRLIKQFPLLPLILLYAQYFHTADNCYYGELYYQLCEIYEDNPAKTEAAIDRMAHSSEV